MASSPRRRLVAGPALAWAAMAVLAVLNGGFREVVLRRWLAEGPARVASTGILLALIVLVARTYFARSGERYTDVELAGIGLGWAALTVAFEFAVAALEGVPRSEVWAQYDVLAGRVWVLVPLTLLVGPWVLGLRRDEASPG